MNKRYLLLLAWGLLSTIAVLHFWNVNQQQARTNAILSESISLHKKALANEAKSYQAINNCFVVNRGLCDADEFKNTLRVLGDEADVIYNQIVDIESQLK